MDDTDFENGQGMWVNVQGDDFDWTRNQGYTQTKDTGPMEDHTSGNGKYIIVIIIIIIAIITIITSIINNKLCPA